MGLRGRVIRLQEKDDPPVYIPQPDGSFAEFRRSDLAAAFISTGERGGAAFAGKPIPPEHPLSRAARLSSDPWWRESAYTEELPDERGEDLSE
jgi:hypothetical protein